MNDIRFSRAFQDPADMFIIEHMLNESLEKFPELENKEIVVGKTKAYAGRADLFDEKVWLNPEELSYYVVGHELTHLLQGRRGGNMIPGGEVQCDIWTLVRDDIFLDHPPMYLLKEVASHIKDKENKDGLLLKNFNPSLYHQKEEKMSDMLRVIQYAIIPNWQKYANDFREKCINAIDDRKTRGNGYMTALRKDLRNYVANI